jgi:hypothetical protein
MESEKTARPLRRRPQANAAPSIPDPPGGAHWQAAQQPGCQRHGCSLLACQCMPARPGESQWIAAEESDLESLTTIQYARGACTLPAARPPRPGIRMPRYTGTSLNFTAVSDLFQNPGGVNHNSPRHLPVLETAGASSSQALGVITLPKGVEPLSLSTFFWHASLLMRRTRSGTVS